MDLPSSLPSTATLLSFGQGLRRKLAGKGAAMTVFESGSNALLNDGLSRAAWIAIGAAAFVIMCAGPMLTGLGIEVFAVGVVAAGTPYFMWRRMRIGYWD
jgi:hypothetical protein